MHKRDEPFNPAVRSVAIPEGLVFRLATLSDGAALTRMMLERNPDEDPVLMANKTEREISFNTSDPNYRVFVADIRGEIAGLCRYYHSQGIPKEKVQFPAPEGWYCMGILVDSRWRRHGIARFLFQKLIQSLQERKAEAAYSVVDVDNLASIRMHEDLKFPEIGRAPGYLNLAFDKQGILFKLL